MFNADGQDEANDGLAGGEVGAELYSGKPTEGADEGAGQPGSYLWECMAGSPEEWLKEWSGRQETHDMFHNSYE